VANVTIAQFYKQLIDDIAVDQATWDAARDKRDALAACCQTAIREQMGTPVKFFPVGALAQGTQIAPLNDVDGVVTVPYRETPWEANPQQAMIDVSGWIQPKLVADPELSIHKVDISAHAIKIEFADEDFTADLVVAEEQAQGLLIPHCPPDESPAKWRWIETDPVEHREQVKTRNTRSATPTFSREIRLLKWWNRRQKMLDQEERKPLSSFHITALALTILEQDFTHAEGTPLFFREAAALVLRPLRDPAGVGEDIEARDPAYTSALLRHAAERTQRALETDDTDLLRDVFGDPGEQRTLLEGGLQSVAAGGTLVSGLAGNRTVKPVRSHGDEGSGLG
jgi:hypothetical protein